LLGGRVKGATEMVSVPGSSGRQDSFLVDRHVWLPARS
jgi:hypothetical protein